MIKERICSYPHCLSFCLFFAIMAESAVDFNWLNAVHDEAGGMALAQDHALRVARSQEHVGDRRILAIFRGLA
ncbi:hypothetical protein U5922_011030 [Aquicoccus sp. G2-2]|uniref:hypothetical protein n=1 Tax=Aquicoccus sp. G2-2 TaxID=3092120 RepID=UPI002AE0334F|nr:hypothetical protein [Aquicoccus sp. G2-2]MEA1113971.1 hypothetical protein [Aquicoccus sp. G2-2]